MKRGLSPPQDTLGIRGDPSFEPKCLWFGGFGLTPSVLVLSPLAICLARPAAISVCLARHFRDVHTCSTRPSAIFVCLARHFRDIYLLSAAIRDLCLFSAAVRDIYFFLQRASRVTQGHSTAHISSRSRTAGRQLAATQAPGNHALEWFRTGGWGARAG